jgi:primosomal replication protein N
MNDIRLSGIIKNIQHSHNIGDISFDKAQLIVDRGNGYEDVINLRFKSFSNKYKDNDKISITGNVRSYSYKVSEDKNRVIIYVFTYFDELSDEDNVNNEAIIDGRICKINELRTTKSGKHNIHFILANNLHSQDNEKRLNSYIPCIAWGKIAKEIEKYSVNTKLKVKGQLHSREHMKKLENGDVEIRIAHELLVTEFEVEK